MKMSNTRTFHVPDVMSRNEKRRSFVRPANTIRVEPARSLTSRSPSQHEQQQQGEDLNKAEHFHQQGTEGSWHEGWESYSDPKSASHEGHILSSLGRQFCDSRNMKGWTQSKWQTKGNCSSQISNSYWLNYNIGTDIVFLKSCNEM